MDPIHSHKKLLQQKADQFQELNQQFIAYEEETRAIIEELQFQNSKLKSKRQELQYELDNIKQKRRDQVAVLEKDIQNLKKQNYTLKSQLESLQREIVSVENNNESLQTELRATHSLLEEYKEKVEKTMEELACLGMELDDCKDRNQEQTARLQAQIRETEEELNIIKVKHQKHNDESGLRLSNFSWTSRSDKKWHKKNCFLTDSHFFTKKQINQKQMEPVCQQQCVGFEKTMQLMNSLLIELDKKSIKLRYGIDHCKILTEN